MTDRGPFQPLTFCDSVTVPACPAPLCFKKQKLCVKKQKFTCQETFHVPGYVPCAVSDMLGYMTSFPDWQKAPTCSRPRSFWSSNWRPIQTRYSHPRSKMLAHTYVQAWEPPPIWLQSVENNVFVVCDRC